MFVSLSTRWSLILNHQEMASHMNANKFFFVNSICSSFVSFKCIIYHPIETKTFSLINFSKVQGESLLLLNKILRKFSSKISSFKQLLIYHKR